MAKTSVSKLNLWCTMARGQVSASADNDGLKWNAKDSVAQTVLQQVVKISFPVET